MDTCELERLGWRRGRAAAAPQAQTIRLWLVRVPTAGTPLEPLLERLAPEERARAEAKRVAAKRREYVTGQAALRTLLARALGTDAERIRYRRGVKGKPYLAPPLDASGLEFNITHSGGVVVVALSSAAEVGVDVEWHNERTDAMRVARRVFTPAERRALDALPSERRREHFFRLWTCKEALVKCTGQGIHSGLAEFEVSFGADGRAVVSGAWDRQAGVERLQVRPLPLGRGHAGALVHEPPSVTLELDLLDDEPDPLAALERAEP